MRKVLLATTAIVALGGVSAASADISVGGSAEFQYDSWSGTSADTTTTNNNSISTTTDFSISASAVLDNGMTISARTFEDGSADGTASFTQNGFKISDDWGTLGFASDESGDAFATALDITDDEGYNNDGTTISTMKPSTSGSALLRFPISRQQSAASSSLLVWLTAHTVTPPWAALSSQPLLVTQP